MTTAYHPGLTLSCTAQHGTWTAAVSYLPLYPSKHELHYDYRYCNRAFSWQFGTGIFIRDQKYDHATSLTICNGTVMHDHEHDAITYDGLSSHRLELLIRIATNATMLIRTLGKAAL